MSRFRQFAGLQGKLIIIVIVVFCVYQFGYLLGLFSGLIVQELYIDDGASRALTLLFVLALTFILVPAGKGKSRDRITWYDVMLILMSIFATLYYFLFYEGLQRQYGGISSFQLILACLLVIVVIEGTRRMIGLAMPLLAMFFVFFALFCNYLPAGWQGRGYSLSRVLSELYLSSGGIWGIALGVAANVVFPFVLFGSLFLSVGGGKFMIDLANGLLGRFRGGPAKAAVAGSALFGSMSGVVVANVATSGAFTIPLMKKLGYKPRTAGAIEAVASTGGMVLPPVMGASAFLMAEFLSISYFDVCLAAAVPALLYFFSLYVMVDLEALKFGLRGAQRQELPSLKETFKSGWYFLVPILVFFFLLVVLRWTAQSTAVWSIGALLIVAFLIKRPRLTLEELLTGLKAGVIGFLDVGVICAAAGIVIGCVDLTGIGIKFSSLIISISGGNIAVMLLLSALAAVVLGMGLPVVSCYILVVILIAPALVDANILPIAAHLFVFYFALSSFITPPLCMGAFVAAAIAGSKPFETGFEAMRMGAVIYLVPFMFVFRPSLLLLGSPVDVGISIAFAIAGIVLMNAGLVGIGLREAGIPMRLLFLVSGLIIIIVPSRTSDIIGLVLGMGGMLAQLSARAARKGRRRVSDV